MIKSKLVCNCQLSTACTWLFLSVLVSVKLRVHAISSAYVVFFFWKQRSSHQNYSSTNEKSCFLYLHASKTWIISSCRDIFPNTRYAPCVWITADVSSSTIDYQTCNSAHKFKLLCFARLLHPYFFRRLMVWPLPVSTSFHCSIYCVLLRCLDKLHVYH